MPISKNLRIVYAGTPEFAVPPLQLLLTNGIRPLAVLTQPDRPAGRGRKLQASPVKLTAQAAGIAVHQPQSLKESSAFETLSDLRPDLIIVVAYGLIVPPSVLELPQHGCWNIHASLLPRWRGAAPIQRAIEAGDKTSGVCIMRMNEGLDTGPVLRRNSIELSQTETGGSLHDTLALACAENLLDCINLLQQGNLPEPVNQPTEGICYANKLRKDEAKINWSESATVLERRVRAFNPWPVAWCEIKSERTRIWKAERLNVSHDYRPGKILSTDKAGIDIACGEQILRLQVLQKPGGKHQSAAEYLNANTLPDSL